MKVYLAGTVTRPKTIKEGMKCYLSGPHADYDGVWKRHHNQHPEEEMEVFLSMGNSGNSACYRDHETISGSFRGHGNRQENETKIYLTGPNFANGNPIHAHEKTLKKISILESFFYIKEWMYPYIQKYWNFLLDSGAFTFMTGKNNGKGIDWNDYVDRYAAFINELDITLFFELDIDNVVGLKEVERLRKQLEAKTGKQPIPVWHKKRGKENFIQICKDYPYVALGGIVAKEWKRNEYTHFPWFIETAHAHGAKIYGLGFTNLRLLPRYHFDSVDSTAWVYGNRSGGIYEFTGRTLISHKKKAGQRIEPRKGAIHNFREWVKFQQYAEGHL